MPRPRDRVPTWSATRSSQHTLARHARCLCCPNGPTPHKEWLGDHFFDDQNDPAPMRLQPGNFTTEPRSPPMQPSFSSSQTALSDCCTGTCEYVHGDDQFSKLVVDLACQNIVRPLPKQNQIWRLVQLDTISHT